MKLPFRHSRADSRIDPRGEPIAAMIKRVADEQRQRSALGPALTPATTLGEAEQPRAAAAVAPVVPAPASAAPSPPSTRGIAETDALDAAAATCAKGHRFARLSDHPSMDGNDACPHCMVKTLGDYRKIFAAIVRPVKYD
jgi:hypothetical protein